MTLSEIPPQVEPLPRATPERAGRPGEETRSLFALAACLVVAAASWFLLKELGPLLRPLILAVFLAYLVVPIHQRLRRRISAPASAAVIVVGTLLLLWGLAMMVHGAIVELNADLPRLIDRARGLVEEVRAYGRAHLPRGLLDASPSTGAAESQGWDSVLSSMRTLVSSGAWMLAEAFLIGVYLVFLLLELGRFPRRIRAGFEPARAEAILEIIARINEATTSYLRAKAVSSLSTAIPSALVLWAFGVRYPVLWGALIFLGRFIPYVGSLVALTIPILLAFLDLQPAWKPCVVALLLILIDTVTGYVVEPILAGKAVDLSPLAALVCVAFWSLCWGLTGMLLAVPLTAMLKIVCENMASTRPLAVLMAEGDG
jgi:AI-2 transport protein TqsA